MAISFQTCDVSQQIQWHLPPRASKVYRHSVLKIMGLSVEEAMAGSFSACQDATEVLTPTPTSGSTHVISELLVFAPGFAKLRVEYDPVAPMADFALRVWKLFPAWMHNTGATIQVGSPIDATEVWPMSCPLTLGPPPVRRSLADERFNGTYHRWRATSIRTPDSRSVLQVEEGQRGHRRRRQTKAKAKHQCSRPPSTAVRARPQRHRPSKPRYLISGHGQAHL
jgi:hypothetical protein